MLDLCKWKNLFGEVGTGAHSYRIFNIAIVDVLSTVIAAYLTYKLLQLKWREICFWWVLLGWFIAGIIAHRLFCVRTTIDKLLFN